MRVDGAVKTRKPAWLTAIVVEASSRVVTV
jgi:hypothetical protein